MTTRVVLLHMRSSREDIPVTDAVTSLISISALDIDALDDERTVLM